MKLLKITETAELLKLSSNYLYVLTKRGVIPSIKLGGSIRVLRRVLESLISGGNINVNG
ncbi:MULTISPECIES: helix-turn-helix domain-containing protein [Bacillus]|uniref:helix-turn-helix domain-containing protein n=1 Tax=Bacillus TaxID=1386 RepID=UPI001880B7E6|nr:helix-turn-helix domain-containing protein [Bacillus altitudinis]MCI9886044.1 helix-turn-helix domain-containing protein [Bacillus altitudinis]MDM5165912.1 helix-turn-helix domain-containing protein [Bacillus altitudinis]QOV50440.1 helix-turn-helix domain-containing protein [Bacillus altitudinis]